MPVTKPLPYPDFDRLRKTLLRQSVPDRPPLIELFADREIMEAVIGCHIPDAEAADWPLRQLALDRTIRFWYETGYDYVTVQCRVDLPQKKILAPDTAPLKRDQRAWISESSGMIETWDDFERYPWPKPEDVDYFDLEYVGRNLPNGMQMIFLGPGGQLENMMWIMGYQPLSYALNDDPTLVEAVSQKVGELLVNIFTTAASFPGIGALWLGDDMGFKTGTMISPAHLRQYVFPWQKKLAQAAHDQGLPFLLHSCGDLSDIMDELIEEVGIDAKHSFEDVILPVWEAKQRYGDRIAILGGIDVDFLTRASEEEVRARTRWVLERCAPGGGYCVGTGNSVANYIPTRNYLAMVEEARGWR